MRFTLFIAGTFEERSNGPPSVVAVSGFLASASTEMNVVATVLVIRSSIPRQSTPLVLW